MIDQSTHRVKKGAAFFGVVFSLFLCALFVLAVQSDAAPTDAGTSSPQLRGNGKAKERPKAFKNDELLVKFRVGVPDADRKKVHGRHQATLLRDFGPLRLHHVRTKKGVSLEEALASYRQDPEVEYAEPNFTVSASATPNDPKFPYAWALHNALYYGHVDVHASEAWDITTGDRGIVVAVLDTGIDYTHEDLAANIWVNQAELNGAAGSDDDGNGYVDDIHGIDVVNNDSDPMDDNYHGTHVAGIIGAAGNNGVGVTGMNWNVQLLPCKFLGADGTGDVAGAITCLQYVRAMKDRGYNIVATNNSWGWSGAPSAALRDAIAGQPDILFLAGAGNDAADNDRQPFYPASYELPNVLSVASFDEYGNPSSFSNFGSHTVHIAAPGSNITSTIPGNYYASLSGTSMATPFVSGLAALLKAQDPVRNGMTIRNLILAGGDPATTPDRSRVTATGKRLNAYGSLTCTDRPTFAVLSFPKAPAAGVPATVSVLSINCGAPVGPVSMALPGGGSLELRDDGVAPDLVAGDGIFTGIWIPTDANVAVLAFSSAAGSDTVATPPVTLGQGTAVPPAMDVADGVTLAAVGVPYSQSFAVSGGVAPLVWSLLSGALPPGLSLDGTSGEIVGTPTAGGVYKVTVAVTDAVGMKDRKSWTIFVNQDMRPGWPQVMEKRNGSGFLPKSYAPVVADLYGDGREEIIAVDGNTLYVFDGDGLVNKTVLPSLVTTPVVADLNGDGRMEIVVVTDRNYESSAPIYAFDANLSLLPGFPAGAYPTENGSAGEVKAPVVADLDGDGAMEIILQASPNYTGDPNYGKNVVVAVDAHGNTLPGWPVIAGQNATDTDAPPAVGDLELDGSSEIVVAAKDGFVHIFRKDGSEAANWQFDQPVDTIYAPVLADLDANGQASIILKYEKGGATVVTVFDRNGVLRSGWPRTFNGVPPLGLIAADIDGDGVPEIIFATGNSYNMWRTIQALRPDGSSLANWPIQLTQQDGNLTYDGYPVVADVNGDGTMDILVVTNGALFAFDGTGARIPGFPKYTTPYNDVRSTAAVGDLDANGRLDIVLKSEDGMLYAWEMPQTGTLAAEWPMYRHDLLHSGELRSWLITEIATPTSQREQVIGGTRAAGTTTGVTLDTAATAGPVSYPTATTWQAALSALPDGRTIVTVTDSTGRKAVRAIFVDTTPPTVVISSPAAGLTNNNRPLLAYTASEGAVTVTVDGVTVDTSSGALLDTLSDGTHTVRVEAIDALHNAGFAQVSFTLDTAAPTVAISSPAAGTTPDNTPLLTYAVSDGSVVVRVDGVVVSKVSGSNLDTLANGTHTVRVEATDAAGNTGSAEVTFTVNNLPLAVATTSLPGGTAGVPYSQTLTATGGIPPYSWSIASGSLPSGLTLNAATGAITGTPTTAGTSTFTVRVTDAASASTTRSLSIVVAAAQPDLVVTSITGPASVAKGGKITLTATVKNQGQATAAASTLTFYLSPDATIVTGDTGLGDKAVGSIAAGGTATVSLQVTVPKATKAGSYYIGAIADRTGGVAESNESNNALAGYVITVN